LRHISSKQELWRHNSRPLQFNIGETSRPLEVNIKEHKYNLTQGLLEKSKVAQHAYKEGHKICWKEVKVLQIEPKTTYRKYKEFPHVSLIDHPISQPSLDISPICIPITAAEIKKLQLRPVQTKWKNNVFMLVSHREFISLVMTFILIIPWC
jgi:hypothetical protein